MCFSPEADLVSGVIITAIGIEAMGHVRRPGERALAALPIVLGIHQLIEAVVWLGLQDRLPSGWSQPAATAYLLIAFGVLPIFVPAAIAALEPEHDGSRMAVLMGLGVLVAALLVEAILRGPVDVAIDGRHLAYEVDVGYGGLLVALYVLVTCGAVISSSHRTVRAFGIVNLVVVLALALIERSALISLWCTWAAVTSIAISLHLRRGEGVTLVSGGESPRAAPAPAGPPPDR